MKNFKYKIEFALFVSGAVVMVLEIVGSRLLSPYFGNSLYTWTALIGIVLGALSLGYYYGGKLADRELLEKTLGKIMLLASFLILILYLLCQTVLPFLRGIDNIQLWSVISAIVLFGPVSTAMGMISPYAVRLKLRQIENSGQVIGSLYAISTLGSIFGTFMAGFFLISFFGSRNIVLGLMIVMALLASLHLRRENIKSILAFLLIIFLAVALLWANHKDKSTKIVDIDTPYERYFVFDGKYHDQEKLARFLSRDYRSADSAAYLDGSTDPVFNYVRYYRFYKYFQPEAKKALMIGGGTFTYSRDFLARDKEAKIDVVEIDRKLLDVARNYFFYQDDERQRIYFEDGRTFLNRSKEKYDVVFIDAYKSDTSVPYQLTTKEAVSDFYRLLNPGGVVLANIVGSIDGDRSKFIKAEYNTYKKVFKNIYLFPVSDPKNLKLIQNILFVATDQDYVFDTDPSDPFYEYKRNYLQMPTGYGSGVSVLTDDYAPVEQYIMGI